MTLRKTCHGPPPSTRAASFSSVGIDWSAPSEIRKKYGEVSQTLTRITETFAQLESNSHGHVDVQQLVDDAEVVVQEPLPDEQRQEARESRTGG